MPENRSNGGEILGAGVLVLILAILAIVRAIVLAIQAVVKAVVLTIFELGYSVTEKPWISFPVLLITAALAYIIEVEDERLEGKSVSRKMRLLAEASARAVAIFLSSGGIALLSILGLLNADSSLGKRVAFGWIIISGIACVTYVRIFLQHQRREREIVAAEKREEELEIRRQKEEEAQERERRKQKLAQRLGDIRLFLEDHYFEGALLALDELDREYPNEYLAISQVRRRVKDSEFAYHKKRAEPHLQRLDGLLAHLDQMKQAKFP